MARIERGLPVFNAMWLRTALAVLVVAAHGCARTAHREPRAWTTAAWGACDAAGCGWGVRLRDVSCTAEDGDCSDPQPPTQKPCFVACRHHRDKLQWSAGAWGPCLNVTSTHLLNTTLRTDHGIMARNVTCLLHEGKAADPPRPQDARQDTKADFQVSVDEENCHRVSRKPDRLRACAVPVAQDCVVSAWLPGSPPTRQVLVAPRHGGKPCPELSQGCQPGEPCADSTERLGPGEFALRLGSWQACVPPDSVDGAASVGSPTSAESAENFAPIAPIVGVQRREVTCIDHSGAAVDMTRCPSPWPARVRACVVPTPCAVSPWSAWRRAQEGCADDGGGGGRAELHERRRDVIRLATGDGEPCPHLLETRSNTEQLPSCALRFRWLASRWSDCVSTAPDGSRAKVACGGGVQLRTVSCAQLAATAGAEPVLPAHLVPVSSDRCAQLPPLPAVQRCEQPCVRDCLLSPWAEWGPCLPANCSVPSVAAGVGRRLRIRRELLPPSAGGLACAALTQTQPCAEPRCFRWREAGFGACVPVGHSNRCGPGSRRQTVTCVDADGTEVETARCPPPPPSATEPCWLPCPTDCVVSAWSEWSPCSAECKRSENSAAPIKWRSRLVVAPPGIGGRACAAPLNETRACNEHGCGGFAWLALPWSECSAEGRQSRDVWCADDERADDADCAGVPKPETKRACDSADAAECLMSGWSAWSACPSQCVPDASSEVRDGEVAPLQFRHRLTTSHAAAACPDTEQLRPCPLSAARCASLAWAAAEWSRCQQPAGQRCGNGFMTRGVWCYRNRRVSRVSPGLCTAPAPPGWQACTVDCARPCAVSAWTPWSPCQRRDCDLSTRTRQLVDGSLSSDCGHLTLAETRSCPCLRPRAVPASDWSSWLPGDASTQLHANGGPGGGACGLGQRVRALACIDEEGNLLEPSLCTLDRGSESEPAMWSCPVDCLLSAWSSWSPCPGPCGPATSQRNRTVLREARDGGRPCGATQQTQPCAAPCGRWEPLGWSRCAMDGECGAGEQERAVRCVVDGRQVPDERCDLRAQPADVNRCHVACPEHCLVGTWSEWADCPQPCDASQERQRTRSVLRMAANPSANPCPPLIEVQSCQLNETCFEYAWQATPFGSCLPLGGSACGEGVQSRLVSCLRSDGRAVPDSLCAATARPGPTDKWCYVDCAVDCELSDWSAWDDSRCQCGQSDETEEGAHFAGTAAEDNAVSSETAEPSEKIVRVGVSTRQRRVLTASSDSGRPCSSQPLEQRRPCEARPCYAAVTGAWGPCQLEGAACGHGVALRSVSCAAVGSRLRVDLHLCAGGPLPAQTQPCFIPCRGDCHLSGWSAWSHCHRDCAANAVGGYESRSRAVLKPSGARSEPCPAQLFETRACSGGPCLRFHWAIVDGKLTCARSDGLPVTGGCDGIPCRHCECDPRECEDATTDRTTAAPDDQIRSSLFFPPDDPWPAWLHVALVASAVVALAASCIGCLLCARGSVSDSRTTAAKA